MTRFRAVDNIPGLPYNGSRVARGIHGQENVPAQQQPAQEEAWIPRSDEDRKRPAGAEAPSRQRSEEIDGLEGSHGEKFLWRDRLHHRREFDAVYSRGARIAGPLFVLFLLPNQLGRSRLGVTLSRKVGNAVARNAARRRLREIFRRWKDLREASLDIVVHGRPGIAGRPQAQLKAELERGFGRYRRRMEAGE